MAKTQLTGSQIKDADIATSDLANGAVTYEKIQNVSDVRLLGRSAGSAGSPQEITLGTGLSLAAGQLVSTVTGCSVLETQIFS